MQEDKLNQLFKSISDVFSVLANPDRIRILSMLLKQEMDVNEIQSKLGVGQSRVSQHLKLLKLTSLVIERREGRHVYYSIKDTKVSQVVESVINLQMAGIVGTDPEMMVVINELLSILHI